MRNHSTNVELKKSPHVWVNMENSYNYVNILHLYGVNFERNVFIQKNIP